MNLFDLKDLNSKQEVPKIIYKPINIYRNNIYFEKIVESKEDVWCDGIWKYELNTNNITRMDAGHHVKFKEFYDVDTPEIFLDGSSKGNNKYIFFITLTEIDSESYLEFYSLDVKNEIQKRIFGFKFSKESLIYKKLEILNSRYLILRFTQNIDDISINNSDELYLIDVEEKKYYKILDEKFYLNIGNFFVFKNDISEYLIFEELYIDLEDKYEILNSDDVEFEFKTITNIDKDIVFNNAIKIIKLESFVNQIKSQKLNIEFDVKDSIVHEGYIEIIGETNEYIFYKKGYYPSYLKNKGDFLSLRNIGSDEIYRFDKTSLEVFFLKNLTKDDIIKTNRETCYILSRNNNSLSIIDLTTDKILFKANENLLKIYDVLEMVNSDLIILMERESGICNLLEIKTNEIILKGNDILILEKYIFSE